MAKFCTSCGTKLADDAIFCTNCGKRQEKLSSVLQAESDGGLKPAPGPSMADAKPQPVAAEMKMAEKTPESVHRPSTLVKTKPATARIEQERTVKISEKTGTPTQKSSQDPNERLLAAAQQLLEITRPAPQIGKARKLLQMALACGADADRIAKLLLIAELIDELEKLKQSVTGNPPIPVERGSMTARAAAIPSGMAAAKAGFATEEEQNQSAAPSGMAGVAHQALNMSQQFAKHYVKQNEREHWKEVGAREALAQQGKASESESEENGKEDEAEEIATEETVAENAEVETAEVETDTNEVEAVEESSEGAGEEDSSGWFDSLFSDDEEE